MAEYSLSFTANYNDTDFTRTYELSNIDSISANVVTIANKVNAINASLAAGSDTLLANLFVSDDYDASNDTGYLVKLSNVKLKAVTETYIQPTTNRLLAFNPDEILENFDEYSNEHSDDLR